MNKPTRQIIGERDGAGWPISAPLLEKDMGLKQPGMAYGIAWQAREDGTFCLRMFSEGRWDDVPILPKEVQ